MATYRSSASMYMGPVYNQRPPGPYVYVVQPHPFNMQGNGYLQPPLTRPVITEVEPSEIGGTRNGSVLGRDIAAIRRRYDPHHFDTSSMSSGNGSKPSRYYRKRHEDHLYTGSIASSRRGGTNRRSKLKNEEFPPPPDGLPRSLGSKRPPPLNGINGVGAGGRPWQEVNEDVSSRMIAASSDSPPIIPKRDYDDNFFEFHQQRKRQQTPTHSDTSADAPDEMNPAAGALVPYQPPPQQQQEGPFQPVPMGAFPMMAQSPFGAPVIIGDDGMPIRMGPDPGELFTPFGPVYPMPPSKELMEEERKRFKKHMKKAKRSKSMEHLAAPPLTPRFGPGPPMAQPGPMPFFYGPPMVQQPGPIPQASGSAHGSDVGADPNSQALVPYGGGSQGMPVALPMSFAMPMQDPFYMPQGMPMGMPMPMGGQFGGPMMGGFGPGPMHPHMMPNGPMMNGKSKMNGTTKINISMKKKKPKAKDEEAKHSTCYIICCRGHTQVLWIIIGIVLVGVILGLVLGLTLIKPEAE